MTKTDTKKRLMIDAMEKALGIVTSACKSVGISRETHYRWLREDKDYKDAISDIRDIAIDFAESSLHRQIKDGNTAATIFYLKTQGKKRGYIEKQEIENTGQPNIIIQPLSQEAQESLDDLAHGF